MTDSRFLINLGKMQSQPDLFLLKPTTKTKNPNTTHTFIVS